MGNRIDSLLSKVHSDARTKALSARNRVRTRLDELKRETQAAMAAEDQLSRWDSQRHRYWTMGVYNKLEVKYDSLASLLKTKRSYEELLKITSQLKSLEHEVKEYTQKVVEDRKKTQKKADEARDGVLGTIGLVAVLAIVIAAIIWWPKPSSVPDSPAEVPPTVVQGHVIENGEYPGAEETAPCDQCYDEQSSDEPSSVQSEESSAEEKAVEPAPQRKHHYGYNRVYRRSQPDKSTKTYMGIELQPVDEPSEKQEEDPNGQESGAPPEDEGKTVTYFGIKFRSTD